MSLSPVSRLVNGDVTALVRGMCLKLCAMSTCVVRVVASLRFALLRLSTALRPLSRRLLLRILIILATFGVVILLGSR